MTEKSHKNQEHLQNLKERVDTLENLLINLTDKLNQFLNKIQDDEKQLKLVKQYFTPNLETSVIYDQMLSNNKSWAAMILRKDPDYFKSRAQVQKPHVLWIGCSDSRVHPSELTGLLPGEIFVHRNVANQCYQNDLNMLSVLQYAVEVLKVPEVVVVGHYGCGGVNFAMKNDYVGIINQWVSSIKEIYAKNFDELNNLSEDERARRLVELNIIEQATNLCKLSYIQKSWRTNFTKDGMPLPRVNAWVYDLSDGIIRELNFKVDLLPFQSLKFKEK